MSSSTELQVILNRLNDGDVRARDELIARAYERLRRLAAKMLQSYPGVRDRQSSEDLLHDAYPRLRRALEAVPPTTVSEFFPLAALQIRRELLDAARTMRRQQPGTVPLAPPDPTSDAGPGARGDPAASTYDPVVLARWHEFHERAGDLPSEERVVFDLLYYAAYTQAEAAEILSVSVPTIKRRWTSARLRLSELLTD